MIARGLFVGFGVGVAVGAGGCYLYLSAVKEPDGRRAGRAAIREDHGARRLGLPETDIVREFEGYIASYDYRTRNPKWVIEHITRDSSSGSANRDKSEFFPDPGVEPRFSAKLSDFRGSGYDRGHMAPAADHKGSQKAMDETFSMVNISPQVGAGFNRDYWARFERFVKELTNVAGDVYVVTGPLWMPTKQPLEGEEGGRAGAGGGKWTLSHDWIGKPPALVAVPTHYYKVVVADPRGGGKAAAADPSPLSAGAVAVGAFVMPNQPIDPRTPLAAYVVPLEDLEQVAGIQFFPALLGDTRRRAALDTAATGWRQAGMAQLKPFDRVTMKQAFAALPPPSTPAPESQPAAAGATQAAPPPPLGTPASGSDGCGGGPPSRGSPSPPPPAKTPEGAGVLHLCDVSACKLPSPDFYLRGSGGSSGGGGGSGGRGSGGRGGKKAS